MGRMLSLREKPWFRLLPNALTIFRLALVVPAAALLLTGHPYMSLGVYLLAGLTDVLDGWIARKYSLVTDWGKVMDPLADKLMLVAVIACMVIAGDLPLWVVVLVFSKELIMVAGGLVLYYGYSKAKLIIPANRVGKLGTLLFTLAVVLTFLKDFTYPYNWYCMVFAVAFSIFSLLQYAILTIRQITRRKSPHEAESRD